MGCFEGKPVEQMTPQPEWLQNLSKQFGQQLSGGMKGGATQMPGGLFNQWQGAAQTPSWMSGVGDVFSQGYQAPSAWGQAQDIYGQMGQYQPQAPQAWGQAGAGLSEMARTGMPTTADPWYRQMQKTLGSQLKRSGADLAEKFGLGGMRYSSGLGAQLGQLATEGQERLGAQFLGREMQAQEAARGRQMGAYGGLGQLGQMQAGLGMFGQQMRGQAASGLAGLGQMQQRAPMDWAQAATGAAGAQQRMNLQGMQPGLSEFYRMAPESNPWMQQMQQYFPGAFGGMQQQPQMYNPSGFSQVMDVYGGMQEGAMQALPYLMMASSREFKKDISRISPKQEDEIYAQMKETPLFNYRYKFEPNEQKPHLGLITEKSPQEVTMFDNKAVGLYEYISALHATVKVLSKKIEALEN